jgi:hypothetical protein
MSEKYKFLDPQGMYFVTMATVGWVDLFTRFELKHVITLAGARLQRVPLLILFVTRSLFL